MAYHSHDRQTVARRAEVKDGKVILATPTLKGEAYQLCYQSLSFFRVQIFVAKTTIYSVHKTQPGINAPDCEFNSRAEGILAKAIGEYINGKLLPIFYTFFTDSEFFSHG